MEEQKNQFLKDAILYLSDSKFFHCQKNGKILLKKYDYGLVQDSFMEGESISDKLELGITEPDIEIPLSIAKEVLSYFPDRKANELPIVGDLCYFWDKDSIVQGYLIDVVIDHEYKIIFKTKIAQFFVQFVNCSKNKEDITTIFF